MDRDALAAELLNAYDEARRLSLPSARGEPFTVEAAYEVADRLRAMRLARGERDVGYKIGFTNRTIWPRYGVYGPIWAPVWDTTVQWLDGTDGEVSLRGLVQPRLEPEIVFGFAAAPRAGMDTKALAGCLAWVAHGIEIVQTHFDDWRFEAADTVADFGLHGRLFIGPRVPMSVFPDAAQAMADLQLELLCDERLQDQGSGRNVLDGPLNALRLWVDAMAAQPQAWPIRAGDVVTTGTLTDAWPLQPGQRWQTRPGDERLAALALQVRD